MFTAQLLGDRKDEQRRRRIVNVKFNSSEKEFDQEFQFSIDTNLETIKKTIKQFLDELNLTLPALTDLEPATPVEPTPPTQAELDKQAWDANWAKLQLVDKLIDAGVLTGQETQIVALRNKVKADFKPAYLG
jgi:hypothetical protein